MNNNPSTAHTCSSCGQPMTSDARFCGECGAQGNVAEQGAGMMPPPQISEQPQQSRSRLRGSIIGGAVALVVIVLVYFSPYISIYQLRRAAEANDIEGIRDRVDFPAFRESAKEMLQDAIATQATQSKADDNPFAGIGAVLAGGFASSLVDTMVTPKNVARLIRGESLDASVFAGALGTDGGNTTPPHHEPSHLETAMGYESVNRFAVRVTNLAEPDSSGVVLVFTRSGFGWTLTGIRRLAAQKEGQAAATIPKSTAPPATAEKNATAQQYLATLRNTSGGYDLRTFLELPDIKAGLSKFFEKQPKIVTSNGEIDMESDFTYGLTIEEDGFPKVVDDTLAFAGCTPHACDIGQSFLSVNLTSKMMQAASFERGGSGSSRITLYGVGSLQAAPTVMQEWVSTRKSETPIEVQVSK